MTDSDSDDGVRTDDTEQSEESTEPTETQHHQDDQTLPTGTIGTHTQVGAIAGSPPWFPCQRCGASRTTHAGLRDLPCEPDRYTEIDPTTHLSVGDQVRARVDQTRTDEEGTRTVLMHTHESGVRVMMEGITEEVIRGDELTIRIESLNPRVAASLERVVSTDERVPSPTLTYIGDNPE